MCWEYAGGLVSWSSRKQRTIALSSTQAEYMAVTNCVQEGLWLKTMFTTLNMECPIPIDIRGNNNGTICLADGQGVSTRSKHINVKYHFIREHTASKTFTLRYIPTAENTADIFTKPLGRVLHEQMLKKLHLVSR
jgi:hypothetical protein